MNKKKALFVLHCSPPVHGAAKVGDTILKSSTINDKFISKFIKIKSSLSIDEIGKFHWSKIFFSFELFVKVSVALITFRPKIIYYTPSPQGFAFYRDVLVTIPIKMFSRFFKGTKVFYHYHARGIREFTLQSSFKKGLTSFFQKHTHLIFISEAVKSELEFLSSYSNISFLTNGVENLINDFEFRKLLINRKQKGEVRVLYLSNMIKEKGYDVILEMAKYFKENSLDINVDFAGAWATNEDKIYFNTFVKANKLEEYVYYHGLVKGEKKKLLFSEATVFVFPSTYKREVFPLSVLEALSFGLPVLAFDIGAVTKIINDRIGIISNRNCIFDDLKRMISHYQTEETYMLCREEYLNNYTTDVFEMNLLRILNQNEV